MTQPVKQLSVLWLRGLLVALVVAMGAPDSATAKARHQPHADITDAAREFAMSAHAGSNGVKVTVSRLDPRLRLARCEHPLEVSFAPGAATIGNTTLGVSCAGPKSWRLYVPARVSVMARVAVATRPLTRGHRIGPGDLRVEERDLASIRGDAVREPERVLGYRVTRAVATNRVLDARLLAAPQLVRRGHKVQVLMDIDGLAIRMTGVALEDGAHGEQVRIRNPVSNRVVEASVVRPGIVRVSHR